MEVGELTQSVEVTTAAPILQTESTATGDAINSTKRWLAPATKSASLPMILAARNW
jgi:hypothetical protein